MISLSKAKLKLFTSLETKKYRNEHRMFMVEGLKMMKEALASGWQIVAIVVLDSEIDKVSPLIPPHLATHSFVADLSIFKQLTTQMTPEGVLVVIQYPDKPDFGQIITTTDAHLLTDGPGFVLESIQDPGNMGTLMRIADWYGMKHIICNMGTVDFLNPKVLRASMGAVFRVQVSYVQPFTEWIGAHSNKIWVADMQGVAVGKAAIQPHDFLLMGNEANGISSALKSLEGLQFVTIPKFGEAESLNVSVAAGILAYAQKAIT